MLIEAEAVSNALSILLLVTFQEVSRFLVAAIDRYLQLNSSLVASKGKLGILYKIIIRLPAGVKQTCGCSVAGE